MYNKILVPIDGSIHAFKALDVATELVDKSEGSLCLLHVVPDTSLPEGLEEWAVAEHVSESTQWLYEHSVGQRMLDTARLRAKANGCSRLEEAVGHGDPAHEIATSAKDKGVDAIVMGTRGLTKLKSLVMGSVAQKTSSQVDCTVITVR